MSWLRAAVLGANDGVISVSSLVVGVAASGASIDNVVLTGIAGSVAGALSMAAGEYISVQSQADIEDADIKKERRELSEEPEKEINELKSIYVRRGLDEQLALHVAQQLTAADALGTHLRDELGITEVLRARPIEAAFASAAAFAVGATIPTLAVYLAPASSLAIVTWIATILSLAALGAIASFAGGAPIVKGATRVVVWGVLAMGLTSLIGKLCGTTL
jgi:VIT1/CCC1 family predicted Fe2+/Mn2+ transporter